MLCGFSFRTPGRKGKILSAMEGEEDFASLKKTYTFSSLASAGNRRFQVSTYGNVAQQCACAEVVSAAGTVICLAVPRLAHMCILKVLISSSNCVSGRLLLLCRQQRNLCRNRWDIFVYLYFEVFLYCFW